VALSIGTSEAFKQWGEANFVALATLLAERGQSVLVLGGSAETALADAIVARIAPALRARVMAITRGSVAETVAALSLVAACVGNDTGATNIAAAVGTPTFVLLGPRPPLDHDPQTLHLLQADRLQDIGVADVERALSTVLS
jgi:heptosyltransferase-2